MKTLPLLDEEIPIGSFTLVTLVAYTANAYKQKGSSTLTSIALNINQAVLLATPKSLNYAHIVSISIHFHFKICTFTCYIHHLCSNNKVYAVLNEGLIIAM